MSANKKTKFLFTIFVLLALYWLDRSIKLGFLKAPEFFQEFFAWLWFEVGFYQNYGGLFGLPLPAGVLIPLSILLLWLVTGRLGQSIKAADCQQIFGWGLILLGGLSNLWDRLAYGFVIDWWEMPWRAVINLADVYILVGVFLLVFARPAKT